LKRAPAAVRDVTASGRSLTLNGRWLVTEKISANAYRRLIITALIEHTEIAPQTAVW